jgi:hypothetical protein
MEEIRWWELQPQLWKSLVPRSGQAATVQGELMRCTGKLADEAYRYGNANWGPDHERMARFVGFTLDDPATFTVETLERLRRAVDEVIHTHRNPDVSGHGSAHYLLTELAVRWCVAHADPIPRTPDPALRI